MLIFPGGEISVYTHFSGGKTQYIFGGEKWVWGKNEYVTPVPGTFTRLRSCIVPAEITEPPQKISGGQNHKYDGR